jgi:hypothetical protein
MTDRRTVGATWANGVLRGPALAGSNRRGNHPTPCAAATPVSCPLRPSRASPARRNPLPNLAPSWNVAPTSDCAVVRRHPETGAQHLDLLKWG